MYFRQRIKERDPRSPIKDKPLRLPGQSLEEERAAIWDDKLEPYALQALFFIVIAALEWWRAWTNMPPAPAVFSIVALLALALAAWRVRSYWPQIKALRLGIEGEKVVGQYLERLREDGYHVFHDVMAPDFNIDHVLVGPAGLFTVETKTRTKPASGDARVTADAEGLLVAGQRPDRDPVVQARAQAGWLHKQLKDSTGKAMPVKPVIVFPGWFIDPSAQKLSNLWVLEPKALPSFLGNEDERMSAGDVNLAAFHLSRMIRSGEKK
jgi:hypothetical protein